MTLEKEKRFLLLLGSYLCGNNATKSEVLDKIEDENLVILSDKDIQVKHNRNELVWRNDFAFVRKHLTIDGFYISGIRNNWGITEAGVNELHNLCKEVCSNNKFTYISTKAKEHAKLFVIK